MRRPVPSWRAERPWLAEAMLCDGLMPWTAEFLPPGADLGEQLGRFHQNGCDHISLTVAAGRDGAERAIARYGFLMREIGKIGAAVQIACDAAAICAACRAMLAGISSALLPRNIPTPLTPMYPPRRAIALI